MKIWCCIFLLASSGAELLAQVQTGPRFVVSTLEDRNRATAMTGDCSLREAIRAANALNQPAVIVFAEGLSGTVRLSSSLGQLSLTGSLSLLGPSARKLSISGESSVRVLRVTGGPHLISGVTIANGKSTVENEGGGGIWNSGTLKIQECAILDNQVLPPYHYVARGGGILTSGSLTMVSCTIDGNTAQAKDQAGASYGDDALGGGVHVLSGGVFTAQTCTFNDNFGIGGAGSVRYGWACGAIYNKGTTVLRNCTISGNDGDAGDNSPGVGGVFSHDAPCTVFSSIIAGNTVTGFAKHRDVRGNFISEGYNLIGAVTGYPMNEYPVNAFNQPTDQRGTDTNLKPHGLGKFQNNGGPTDTFLPDETSLAVDKGKTDPTDRFDQRGRKRRVDVAEVADAAGGDGSDIGAVELGGAAVQSVVEFSEGVGLIRLKADRGVNYTFEFSDNLEPPWTPIGGALRSDGAGNLLLIDPFDPGPKPDRRFYRAVPVP